MSSYRCYFVDETDHVAGVRFVECATDGVAEARADELLVHSVHPAMAADPAVSGLPERFAGFAEDVEARDGDVAQGAIVQMGKLPAAAAARAPDPDLLDGPGEQSGGSPAPPWLREYFG